MSGCSSLTDKNWVATTVANPQDANAWELQGKLAVISPEEKFSTNLYWLHTPESDQLKLTTMLGTSVMSLSSRAGYAKLEVDGQTYEGDDPQALLNRLSNWQFPLTKLPEWVLGIVADDYQVSRDINHRPLQLTDSSVFPPWRIQYQGWQAQSGTMVPRLLRLERGGLKLKIQLNQWQALTSVQVPMDNKRS
ncbi:lipoprotein insertase outer membrane protein LolB [Shewanella sp. A32]|uniref:lipoprotein insertase outer membrane protein LolB n=1 Tax=Shewanella sp. A32 TaxID=3031327 RepID=UPI0023B9BBDC|nr:lipoprotein insertase outer membrane protein LolB [Shewanella sp. A32]MDF0533841.1 lipoprotein insertase outer membrane protein LolB [Shewanella sp. A32]